MRGDRAALWPTGVIAAMAFMLYPGAAEAHLMSTGMGPIYDGMLHFLTSPEDLLPVVGLALLAGLRGKSYGRSAMFTLPLAWLSGYLIGLSATVGAANPFVSAFGLLLVGVLVATDAKLSLLATTALVAIVGLVHGYFNGTGMGVSGAAVVAALGLVFAIFVLVVLVAALVAWLRAHWARIAVRVVGSWIAASGILMLGWALRARLG